jgi:hypothetical protein
MKRQSGLKLRVSRSPAVTRIAAKDHSAHASNQTFRQVDP